MIFSERDDNAPRIFAEVSADTISIVKGAMGVELRYDRESLRRVDEVIEAVGKREDIGMMFGLGSYVGEVFRRVYKGSWVWNEREKTWSIEIPVKGGKLTMSPFVKVSKRFENGIKDSIWYYAHLIHDAITGKKTPVSPPERERRRVLRGR